MATVSLQTVFDEARRAIEAGAADKAIGIAQHILVHFPRMIEGSRLLGEAYLNAGQPEQAAAAFAQVLHADPENIAAYYGQGLALQSCDQRAAAITAFERALEIQPNLADLRTQLMRLYAETPGAAGQFRLSRAGLGRLYARGGMFGQAIDEFRAVLDVDPERNDVKVALAEALWRDGQEDEAMDYCRDVLEQQPDLIKPTVLLGYMLFASGQPEGEALWRRAAAQDATMALARTLFDIMPPIRIEEPVLPEFDEAEWRAQEARRSAEQAPVLAAAAQPAEEDFFADSWLSSAGSAPRQTHSAELYDADKFDVSAPAPTPSASDDDLLASLLGFGDTEQSEPAAEELEITDVQPFAFDDWDAIPGDQQPAAAQPMPASLDEIGLADESSDETDLDNVKPFSFDDWSFEEETPGANASPPATAQASNELELPNVEAFSLDDVRADQSGGVQPFTLEDEEPSNVQPFTLDDETDEPSNVRPFTLDAEDNFGVAPFSLDQEESDTTRESEAAEAGLGDIQPFSLDEWGLDDETAASDTPQDSNAAAGSAAEDDDLGNFQPFSLDELSLDALDNDSGSPLAGPPLAQELEPAEQERGFKWEEPAWRSQHPQPNLPESQDDESIFAKLMRNRGADQQGASVGTASHAEQSADNETFFSLDDESLRLDFDGIDREAATREFADETAVEQPAAAAANESTAPSSADTQPFSLEDLATADDTFSWESDEPASSQGAASDQETVPFSLSDLGLSDEELAELDQQEETAADAEAAGTSGVPAFSLRDLGLSDEELAALDAEPQLSSNEPQAEDVAPFSLSDLGLSDDEIAALNLGDTQSATPDLANNAQAGAPTGSSREAAVENEPASGEEQPDLVPFSLAELGLSDDEIALLNQQEATSENDVAPAETGETGDDLAALFAELDVSGDRESEGERPQVSEQGATATSDALSNEWLGLQEELAVEQPDTRTPDDFLAEAQAGEGDLDAVLQTMPADEPSSGEAGPTPFSLADLGLADDELALFDQSEPRSGVDNQQAGVPEGAAPAWEDSSTTSEPEHQAEPDVEVQPAWSGDQASQAAAGQAEQLPPELPEGTQPVESMTQEATRAEPQAAEQAVASSAGSSLDGLAAVHAQLEANPENDALRLAVARMSQSTSNVAQAMEQYKQLIKRGRLLDDVVDDLQDAIADTDDSQLLRRLHRLLGDAYMKQNRLREAMDEYSWTSARKT